MIDRSGREVDLDRAIDWIRGSLAQGSDIAALVGGRLGDFTSARILGADSSGPTPTIDDLSRGVFKPTVEAAIAELLRSITRKGSVTLVVESDVQRRGDPHTEDAAFVDERVLRWANCNEGISTATPILYSSAYPLNAYVCNGDPVHLGLVSGRELTDVQRHRLAEAVYAVLVSVWDGEAILSIVDDNRLDRE
jgi:hypothetical protein